MNVERSSDSAIATMTREELIAYIDKRHMREADLIQHIADLQRGRYERMQVPAARAGRPALYVGAQP